MSTARWKAAGNAGKEAWAHANTGVCYFGLSRMNEAGRELELALTMFEDLGDRHGVVAASAFMCLARPTDPRVPRWLEEALAFAEETGDRTRKLATLTTLAWHHTLRSLWGSPEDTAVAEDFALQLAQLADELGAIDLAVHGWSLLAIAARFSGRLDEAARHTEALERITGEAAGNDPWLRWAAVFSVTVARGTPGATPPFPPESSADPVVQMAVYLIEAELTAAGRVDEALARIDGVARANLGTIGDLAAVLNGLAFVLAGRGEEALAYVERAAAAAQALDASATARAARAPCGPRSPAMSPGCRRHRRTPRASATRWSCGPTACSGTKPPWRLCAGPRTTSACPASSWASDIGPAADAGRRDQAVALSVPTTASTSLWRIGNDPPQWSQRAKASWLDSSMWAASTSIVLQHSRHSRRNSGRSGRKRRSRTLTSDISYPPDCFPGNHTFLGLPGTCTTTVSGGLLSHHA